MTDDRLEAWRQPEDRRARYRWTVLAAGTVAQISYAALFFGVSVLAPKLQDHFHLSLLQVGIILATVDLGSMLTLLPWGVAADRIGERPVIMIGLGGCAATLAVTAFSSGFLMLAGLLTFAGLAGASVSAASGRAVMHWFAKEQRGLALGIRQAAYPIGGVGASLLLTHLGITSAFLVLAAFTLVGAGAGLLLAEAPVEPDAGAVLDDVARSVLRDRTIWRLSGASAVLSTAQACVVGFAVLYLHEQRGLSVGAAGVVVAIIQCLGGAMRIVAGRRSDRHGARILPLKRIAVALAASVGALAVLEPGPRPVFLVAFVIAGALAQGWSGLAFTATAEIAGRLRSGTALGFQQTGLSLWGTVVPPGFAFFVGVTSWSYGFVTVAATTLVSYPLLSRVPD